MLLKELHRLGVEVAQVCEREEARSFEDIAYERLAAAELPPFDPAEIEAYAFEHGNHSDFGNLNAIAFRNEQFFVELLVWGSASPDIHSHSFRGAFRVLEGGSVHAHYSLTREDWRSEVLIVGEVHLHALDLLQRGDTRKIEAGPAFMHGLYHHAAPSATVVVRTYNDKAHPFQFGMAPPAQDEVVVLTANKAAHEDARLKAIRQLARFMPWPGFEHALLERAATLSPSRLWFIREEFRKELSSGALARIDALMPAPLRDLVDRPEQGLLRIQRGRLRSDLARTVAGVVQYAPDLRTALSALAPICAGHSAPDVLADGLAEVFSSILREEGEGALAPVVVREVLRGRGLDGVFAALAEEYAEASVQENAPHIEAAYRLIARELCRLTH